MTWAPFVSDLGDSTLLLPLCLFLTFLLWRYQCRRAALYLMCAMACCLSAIVALKIMLLACGRTWGIPLESPSAHACMAMFVYGSLGIVSTAQSAPRWGQAATTIVVGSVVAAIGASRVILQTHSICEVVLGLLIGCVGMALFAIPYLRLHRRTRPRMAVLALGSLAVIFVLHGISLPFEPIAERIAMQARSALFACWSN